MRKLEKDSTALLVIDVQKDLTDNDFYQKELFLTLLKQTIQTCRTEGIEVVYIQHESMAGTSMEAGTHGWEICAEIAPIGEERIFRKNRNSAFRHTGLHEYLQSKGIKNLILTGLMTEYCFDTTCKVAFELEYNSYIPKDINSTLDRDDVTARQIHEFYNELWDGRFGEVISTEELFQLI